MGPPHLPLGNVGAWAGRAAFVATSALSLPKTFASFRPRVRRGASEVCTLIQVTGVPTPTRRIFSRSMCLPLGGLALAHRAATTFATPLQSDLGPHEGHSATSTVGGATAYPDRTPGPTHATAPGPRRLEDQPPSRHGQGAPARPPDTTPPRLQGQFGLQHASSAGGGPPCNPPGPHTGPWGKGS